MVNFIGDEWFQKLNKPLEKGEPVYKIGRSTGLSVGRLKDPFVNIKKANGKSYNFVAIVDGLFSFRGDCGALYCVMRIIPPEMTDLFGDVQGFYPFAVLALQFGRGGRQRHKCERDLGYWSKPLDGHRYSWP